MKVIGQHQHTKQGTHKDVNGRFMVRCVDCENYAHAFDVQEAEANLAGTQCAPCCTNCRNLRESFSNNPAAPVNGTCNTILHVCPNDGNKWWQVNTHYHHWQLVTDPKEWDILIKQIQ